MVFHFAQLAGNLWRWFSNLEGSGWTAWERCRCSLRSCRPAVSRLPAASCACPCRPSAGSVAELEAHVDAKLLVRGTRKLALTEAGEAYLAACRRILEQVAEAERGAAGEYNTPQGELVSPRRSPSAGCTSCRWRRSSSRRIPRSNLRLVLSDRSLNIVDEHLDLAIRVGDLPDSSMVAMRVGAIRSVVCASPAY